MLNYHGPDTPDTCVVALVCMSLFYCPLGNVVYAVVTVMCIWTSVAHRACSCAEGVLIDVDLVWWVHAHAARLWKRAVLCVLGGCTAWPLLACFILCSRGPLKGAAGCRRQRRVCTFEFCFLIMSRALLGLGMLLWLDRLNLPSLPHLEPCSTD